MENEQIDMVWKVVENTDSHLFLTGRAGTGKTTFLRNLKAQSPKRMVVLAPTGIAAINAGGVTIHSFFQFSFGPYIPGKGMLQNESSRFKMNKQKLRIIQSIDLLVIDEISMVRGDLLDRVDESLRTIRRNRRPFGGVQLLLIGDLQQLAPVVKDEEWDLLRPYYESPYFFSSKALRGTSYFVIELEKVYRQSDTRFLSLLNGVRSGSPTAEQLRQLNSRYIPGFVQPKDKAYIQLVTHNWQAHQINSQRMEALPGKAYAYSAKLTGNFPEYAYPTDSELQLKLGAQIMFVKNDKEKRFYNGMIGEIVDIDEKGFTVSPASEPDKRIDVERDAWENTRYALNEKTQEIEEVIDGVFSQFPVRLAWAITIHKSQGLTFEHVVIDASHAFAHGQTYVALSRCKTLEGIVLSSPIPASAVITDPNIDRYNSVMSAYGYTEEKYRAMGRAYVLNLLSGLFTFEQERVQMSAIVRLMEEHLSRLYPKTLQTYKERLSAFDLEVMAVSGRFRMQYERMFGQSGNEISDEHLQERITKAARYFSGKLAGILSLAQSTGLDIDNATIAKRMDKALEEWKTDLNVHVNLLNRVEETGFDTNAFLKYRAKVMLDNQQDEKAEKTKKKPTDNPGKTTPNPTENVPSDIENPGLYEKLRRWRIVKMNEREAPAYVILTNKALQGISRDLPTTEKELAAVPGIGKSKLTLYGEEILRIVKAYLRKKD